MQMRTLVIALNVGVCWRCCQAMATRQRNARLSWVAVEIESVATQRAAVLALLQANGNLRLKKPSAKVGIALSQHGYYLAHTANLRHRG
jgi:hypothetical protein